MLIIQRNVGERIVIAPGIEVRLLSMSRKGVRLAIAAPRGVSVLRGEVFDLVAAANSRASESTPRTDGES